MMLWMIFAFVFPLCASTFVCKWHLLSATMISLVWEVLSIKDIIADKHDVRNTLSLRTNGTKSLTTGGK